MIHSFQGKKNEQYIFLLKSLFVNFVVYKSNNRLAFPARISPIFADSSSNCNNFLEKEPYKKDTSRKQSVLSCRYISRKRKYQQRFSLHWHYPTGSFGLRQISRTLSLIPQAPVNIKFLKILLLLLLKCKGTALSNIRENHIRKTWHSPSPEFMDINSDKLK